MNLKKFLATTLACSMVITCFASCTNNDKTNNSSNESSSVSDGSTDNYMSDTENDVKDDLENAKDNIESGIEDGIDDTQSKVDDILNNSSKESKDEGSLDSPTLSDINSLSNDKQGWGQGTIVDENNTPVSCTQFQEKYGDLNAYFIGDNSKDIYLTFDEGYENGYTSQILDVLKEKNCPAVFFVTMPYVKENSDLINRMISEGHSVGNHTTNHPSMPDLDITEMAEEISSLHTYVSDNFNYNMTLFRPPMGEFSEKSLAVTDSLGYKSVFWSFAYKDWDTNNQPDETQSLNKLVSSSHNGAIYLLHAVSKTNTDILGDFIDQMRDKGYNFKTM